MLKDAALDAALADAPQAALRKAGHAVDESAPLRLGATIRRFWLKASWMTTCEIEVELRLGDERGAVLWYMPLEVRVERFIGWFGAAVRSAAAQCARCARA